MRYKRGKSNIDPGFANDLLNIVSKEIAKLPDDKQKIATKKYSENADQIFQDIVDSTVESSINSSRRIINRSVKLNKKDRIKFESRLYKSHKELFEKNEELIGVCVDAVRLHREQMNEHVGDKDKIYPFLVRLHSRILLHANEILALSRAGYGSAANARWRSMHETLVVMTYIMQRGNRTLKLFIDHDAVVRHKSMKSYQEHAEALGNKPFSARELRLSEAKYKRRLKKYGKKFKGEYGWLDIDTSGRLKNFYELEQEVNKDYLRPYYRFSSLSVHTNFSSITSGVDYDALVDDNILLIGPSDSGFEDAISLSVLTLAQATVELLTYNHSFDSLVFSKIILRIEQDAQRELENVIRFKHEKYGLFPDANLSNS